MAGRKTILNDVILEALVASLELGVPVKLAAQAAGIGETSFYVWLERGSNEIQRIDMLSAQGVEAEPEPGEAIFVKFAEQTTRARGLAMERRIKRLDRIAEGDIVVAETTKTLRDGTTVTEKRYAQPNPQPDMFMLERHPDSRSFFGRRDRMEVSGPEGGPIAISVKDELTALIEASARRVNDEARQIVEAHALPEATEQ